MNIQLFSLIKKTIICVIISFIVSNISAQEKVSVEEILNKHLDSIGTKDSRGAIKSMMIWGKSKATFKGRGAGFVDGAVVLASEGEKSLIGMKFDNADYPHEIMGYDGDKFSAKQIRPGVRSVLGDFLRLHEAVFKNGVMGGTLAKSWSLLEFDEKRGKLTYEGTEMIDNKQVYKLNYNPKKGGGLDINFFFEAETFRHVRTEYKRILSSPIKSGGVDASAGQSETRYSMIEDFSDFKPENKLNLPHNYRLFLEIISGNGTVSYEWKMELTNFIFNNPVEAKDFRVDS